jgi:hypothetical protein
MKPDKPYGDIRHEVKMEYMKKYIDPIGYAKDKAVKTIDSIKEINDHVNRIKILIKVYFSDEVQMDETPMGAMRRNQIRKELLEFAAK